MILQLDHVGIAVREMEASIAAYKSNFGMSVDFREKIPERGIELCFLAMPGTQIELIASINDNSTIKTFLDTRGPGIHHLAYRVDNIVAELSRLKNLGHVLLDEKPRPGARGSLIAFLHPKSFEGVLTELVQHKNS